MFNQAELAALPGDNIREKYSLLKRYVESMRITSDDSRVHIASSKNGQKITLSNPPPTIVTPLMVSPSGRKSYIVSEGYINGRLPMVEIAGNQVPIVLPDGTPHAPAEFSEVPPFVVVAQVKFDEEKDPQTGQQLWVFSEALIRVKKPDDLLRTGSADYVSEKDSTAKRIVGHIPLAFLRQSRFFQFTLHNLQAVAVVESTYPRVLYWPA